MVFVVGCRKRTYEVTLIGLRELLLSAALAL